VFACDEEACEAAEMDDVDVDGLPERLPGWAHPPLLSIDSTDDVVPTAPGTAE